MDHTFKTGLTPLMCSEPRILILGSLPSDMSIASQEYYGNPRNLFWRVIAGISDEPVPECYAEKKDLLARHHIALWDVYAAAERQGSLDTNIKDGAFNDIEGIVKKYPTITTIVFNGGKAFKMFGKYLKTNASNINTLKSLKYYPCASTSSMVQSAGWTLDKLIEQWKEIL